MSRLRTPCMQENGEINNAMARHTANESANKRSGIRAYLTVICAALALFICAVGTSAYLFDMKAISSPFTMQSDTPAFAVYSADDRSLNFYKRSGIPSAGDIFEGKKATAIYTGFEKEAYSLRTAPWYGHASLVKSVTVVDKGISPKSISYWFSYFANCETVDIGNINTSNTTSMEGTFQSCKALTMLDLSAFDLSNTTITKGMFNACSSIKTLDLTNWDVANLRRTDYMFYGCSSMTTIYVSDKWDTSGVSYSPYMFSGCMSLVGGNGTKYSASNHDNKYARPDTETTPGYLTYLAPKQVFAVYSANDHSLNFYNRYGKPAAGDTFEGKTATNVYTDFDTKANQAVGPWNAQENYVKSVTVIDEGIAPLSTASWFRQFTVCETMDLSKLDTSNVTDMSCMFLYTRRLERIDLSNWDTSNVTSMYAMFDRSIIPSSGILGVSDFDTSCVKDMSMMFREDFNIQSLNLSKWNTSNVLYMNQMFSNCTSLRSLDLTNWNTSKAINMSRMFYNCHRLDSLDVSHFDTSSVEDMNYMFYSVKAPSLNVSSWDTSNVTNISFMFEWCENIASLDLSNWNTAKVTSMNATFFGCNNLKYLDLSSWDTSNVTTMMDMFYGCKSLAAVDLSNFVLSNVTTTEDMFAVCGSLSTIYASNKWDINNVNAGFGMFSSCTSLVGGNGTVYDPSHIGVEYARIDTPSAPGYLTDISQKDRIDAEDAQRAEDADQTAGTEDGVDSDRAVGIEEGSYAYQAAKDLPASEDPEAIDPESTDTKILHIGSADDEKNAGSIPNEESCKDPDESISDTHDAVQDRNPNGPGTASGIGEPGDSCSKPDNTSARNDGPREALY